MVAFNSRFSSSSSPAAPVVSSALAARRSASQTEAQADLVLVDRFKNGDETAFGEIIRRHQPRILAIAFDRVHDRGDAEEIAQDTFIRAHRALAAFRGESSLATWLHRIAVNLALNRYWYFFRRNRHMTRSFDYQLSADSGTTLADLVPSTAPDPAAETLRDELSNLTDEAMERLAPAHRDILRLRSVLNHSYEEIASTLGIRIGTVKSRIARARLHLRTRLAEISPDFSADLRPGDWLGAVRPCAAVPA